MNENYCLTASLSSSHLLLFETKL